MHKATYLLKNSLFRKSGLCHFLSFAANMRDGQKLFTMKNKQEKEERDKTQSAIASKKTSPENEEDG